MRKNSLKIIFFIVLFFLSSCDFYRGDNALESDLPGSYYTVKKDDSLSSIAIKHKVSADEIADINGIDDPRSLPIGRVLYIPYPDPIGFRIAQNKSKPIQNQNPKTNIKKPNNDKRPNTKFLFPVTGGKITKYFSQSQKNPYEGVGISAPLNSAVKAASSGKVLFVGDDGTRYGLLILVEHDDDFISVYTHLNEALVKKNMRINKGHLIGKVGISGGIKTPLLHFQIRKNQKPVNPMNYL